MPRVAIYCDLTCVRVLDEEDAFEKAQRAIEEGIEDWSVTLGEYVEYPKEWLTVEVTA